MYKKANLEKGFVSIENEVLDLWKKKNIIKKSFEENKGKNVFTFFDGPPTANGMPHAGHILTRVIKDIIPRFKVMQGYYVLRKAGWDTHGLPVELEIEKKLGISGKEQIEEYGVEKFVKECKESVFKYVGIWEEMSNKVGYWVDMENPYITYTNTYIESVWWALKSLYDKGLLVLGHKVMPYCPRCETALSSHEVSQGYKDVKDLSAYVKFKLKDSDKYFLAWTTTPWTLPSNVALCINKKYEYAEVKVKYEDGKEEILILAKELVAKILSKVKCEYEIVNVIKGKDLLNVKYEQLLDFVKVEGRAFEVIHGDFVTAEDGTGIVHIAPAHGEDDSLVCKKEKMAFINVVDKSGKFIPEIEPWKNKFVRNTNEEICDYLEKESKLFLREKFEHSYPHCWRCDTPLLYYPKRSWFVAMSKERDNLLKNNAKVNWYPETIKNGRFGKFLENVIDWGISRDRYWGTPLPIWKCTNEQCSEVKCIGSIKELKENSIEKLGDIELHKPYIDKVFLRCPKCGSNMERFKEVIDCWFDSGSMPFAQWHYPFENKEIFEHNFPAQFISEAIDQTRGWFYTLSAIGTTLFNRIPFENCIVLGHVLDEKGQKMSKSKKNGVDPLELLNTIGADATRWYFYNGSQPWLSSRLSIKNVEESQRGFILTLFNIYSFYTLYANIDKFNPYEYFKDEKEMQYASKNIMDKWIISRLNTTIKNVTTSLEKYDINEASKYLERFTDELSNWYIRRNRERFWAGGMEQDKINAYLTLFYTLYTLITLSAPFIPFLSEEIYQNIVYNINTDKEESIHLTKWPESFENLIDDGLEKEMNDAMSIVRLGRAARNQANIKNRQPLSRIKVSDLNLASYYINIIKEELNVLDVELGANMDEYVTYNVLLNLPVIGKKYGKLIPKIKEEISKIDQKELVKRINKENIILNIDSNKVELTKEDLLVTMEGKSGYSFESDYTLGIVLDTTITKDIKDKGYVREIISKIQNLRKSKGLEVVDRINLNILADSYLKEVISKYKEDISKIVLANNISLVQEDEENIKNNEKNKDFEMLEINDRVIKAKIEKDK